MESVNEHHEHFTDEIIFHFYGFSYSLCVELIYLVQAKNLQNCQFSTMKPYVNDIKF